MPTHKPPGDGSDNSESRRKPASGKKQSAIQRQMKAAGLPYVTTEPQSQPTATKPQSTRPRTTRPPVNKSPISSGDSVFGESPAKARASTSGQSNLSAGARKRIGTTHNAQVEALTSMQDLISERKGLLASLLSDKPYRVKTYHEYQQVLGEQQAGWDMIQKRRRAYTADKQLFDQLRVFINLEFDRSKHYGSFAQHLLNCSSENSLWEQGKQSDLTEALRLRIPSTTLLLKGERPVVVRDAVAFLNRRHKEQQHQLSQKGEVARVVVAKKQTQIIAAKKRAQLARDEQEQADSLVRLKSEQVAQQDAAEAIQRREASELKKSVSVSDAELLAAMSHSNENDRLTMAGANDPKLSLVVEMERLINANLQPKDRAEKVKALHREWKSQVLTDREHNQQLLIRFKKASEMAYAPSKRYYKELAARLQSNLQKRIELSNGLQKLCLSHSDESADWQHIEQVLRTAQNHWDEYTPTDRQQTESVRVLFDQNFAQLSGLFEIELDRNRDNKEHLIDIATSLSRQKPSEDTAPALAAIQQQWQDVGVSRDSEDLSLGKKFSDLCALVETQKADHARELELQRSNAKRAQNLIDRVQSYTNKEGLDLLGSGSAIELIMTEFPGRDTLPEAEAQVIHQNMEAAHVAYLAKIEATKAAQQAQAMADFHTASELVNKVETAYIENLPANELAQLLKAAQDFVGSVAIWPRKGELLLRQRLKNIQDIKA